MASDEFVKRAFFGMSQCLFPYLFVAIHVVSKAALAQLISLRVCACMLFLTLMCEATKQQLHAKHLGLVGRLQPGISLCMDGIQCVTTVHTNAKTRFVVKFTLSTTYYSLLQSRGLYLCHMAAQVRDITESQCDQRTLRHLHHAL